MEKQLGQITFTNKQLRVLIFPLVIEQFLGVAVGLADSVMVASVGEAAVSAVSLVDSINVLLFFAMNALATGGAVVCGQFLGRKDTERANEAGRQLLVFVVLLGTAVMAVLYLAKSIILHGLFGRIDADVMAYANTYFLIVEASIPFMALYSAGAAIFRVMGNSSVSMKISVVMNLVNVCGNAILIFGVGMGVEGVALATILSQATSAVLVILTLLRTESCIRLRPRSLRLHWHILKKIIFIGIPAAIQMAITSFSNVFVQSYINHFGADCMSGWTAYSKIDQLLFLPMQTLGLAATTFVGQNLGSGQVDRAKKGVRTAVCLALGVTLVLIAGVIYPFASSLVTFFNQKPEVVEYGTLFLHWISPFYLLCCFNQVYGASLRGAGHSRQTMVIMLGSFVVFRQIYLFIMANYISNTVLPIAMSYPAGWFLCSGFTLLYYRRADLSKNVVVDERRGRHEAIDRPAR